MVISLLVTSPIVKGSGNNRYNCFWHRIAWLDLSNRRWQRFTSISSIPERGCNAHVKIVVLVVHCLLRTRLSLISSYLFCSWTRFARTDFHGLLSLIRTTHYGRVWSLTFSNIISCPLVHGSSREMWLFLDIRQWIGAMCLGFIGGKSRRFT